MRKFRFVPIRVAMMLVSMSVFFLFGYSARSFGEPPLNAYDAIEPAVGFDDVKLGWTFDHFCVEYKRPSWVKTKTFDVTRRGKAVQVLEVQVNYDGGATTLLGFTRANRPHTGYTQDFMFIAQRLVQLGTTEQNRWVTTFGRHRVSLSEAIKYTPTMLVSSYDQFNNGPGGVFGRYYYDDVKGGIAYAIDGHAFDFLNPSSTFGKNGGLNPDWIIVHKPMQPIIPVHDTDNFKEETISSSMSMQYLLTYLQH
jgi:hypothetical protein